MSNPVIVRANKVEAALAAEGFRRHASLALMTAGLVFLFGTAVDFAILWVFQRDGTAHWEFTALASTSEGLPRIVLAIALLYAALHTRASTSLLTYRLLALGLMLTALAAAVIGAMMITDYFVLRRDVNPEAIPIFQGATIKTVALCSLYVILLLPIGVLGMRRPKGT